MTTINRVNSMINERDMAAKVVALFVLASFSTLSAAAINHSGNLVKSSLNTMPQSVSTSQVSTAKVQTVKNVKPIVLSTKGYAPSIQSQSQSVNGQLQPAVYSAYNSNVTTATVQSSINNMQLTIATPQNAASIR